MRVNEGGFMKCPKCGSETWVSMCGDIRCNNTKCNYEYVAAFNDPTPKGRDSFQKYDGKGFPLDMDYPNIKFQ